MEKNKNRSDLLAAGRKRLQQFRQKKDGKGHNSKPSSKTSKSGLDTAAGASSEVAVTQQHVADGEISKHDSEDTIAFPESSTRVDSEATHTSIDKSELDITMGTATEAAVPQQHGADGDAPKHDAADTIVLSESSSVKELVASDITTIASGNDVTVDTTSETAATKQQHADAEIYEHRADDTLALSELSSRVDLVAGDNAGATYELLAKDGIDRAPPAGAAEFQSEGSGMGGSRSNQSAVDGCNADSGIGQNDGSSSLVLEGAKNNVLALREKLAHSSISLSIDFSAGLGMLHGEEQVTDVGAMQEVGYSSGYQIDKGIMPLLEEDGRPPSNDFTESTGDNNDSGNTPADEEIHVTSQLSKTDYRSLTDSVINDSGEGQEGYTHSGVVPTVSSVVTGQPSDGTSSGPNEEDAEILDVSGVNIGVHAEGTYTNSSFVNVERLSEFGFYENEISLACKQVDLSSILDGSVTKLSQLAEILREFDDDEFNFLVLSRKSSIEELRDTNKMKSHDCVHHYAFERLKEHLYVTSLSMDAFHLQLSEHQKWIDQVCAINSSLVEVKGKNEILTKEVVQSRYELQEVVSEREELQKQLLLAKAEVEAFAAKVDELQNKLEMVQGEISSISSELVDCKKLGEGLQAENDKLNESYILMANEKKQLLEENGKIRLENEKMAGELSQSNASLESLQTLLRDERKLHEEENDALNHEISKLLADLVEYKCTVEALEVENINLNEILTPLSEKKKKLEAEKALAANQFEKVSKELMDGKDLIASLQIEISNLNGQITFMKEERIELEEEKNSIFREHEKQSHELVELKVLEAGLQVECSKAVDDLKAARTHINQLTEENETLRADLEFHKCKVKELDQEKCSSQYEELAKQDIENDFFTLQKSKSERKLGVYDDSSGFVALRGKLEDAKGAMQKLENEIEGMHLLSASLIRSTDKVVSPGVSRLIQAFESKNQADDQDLETTPSTNGHTIEDSYMRTKMVTQKINVLLEELIDDSENASEFCRALQNNLVDSAQTDNYESLAKHTDQVEEVNIKLMVLSEAMRESMCHALAKEGELLHLCGALQNQEAVLKSENNQLQGKLNDFQAQINELQSILDEFCRDSDEMVYSISNQLQTLQDEVANRESVFEEERNSVSAQVLQEVGRLDAILKKFNSLADGSSKSDVVSCVAASVDGASKEIEALYGQLEAAHRDCQNMSDKTDMALNVLHKLYGELNPLVKRSFGDEAENVLVDDKVQDLLHPDVHGPLLEQLKRLFRERLDLESENKQLSSELLSRARETDELQKKCLKSDTMLRLIEEIKQSLRLEGIMMDADEPASLLESLIHLLVQKYSDADQGFSLSASLEMQLSDLRGQMEHLDYILVQYENENVVFKHSLKSAEGNIIALNSRLHEKVTEFEQSEQRVSSLREKLSIAVSKGKGLISQRDSLKQSLADTSRELEKCSQELLSKDARLHEFETKLKVYSEAGERMEALESELSYIRNSATALRESFLLKDSVLQRIEEILEDLELPENFHSRDIIEKIDWVAKSVGGRSLPLGDWDRRSSVGVGSYSDSGFVGGDGLKEDMQPNPNSTDDLRRRFEELQNKFYGLAEQNEMLEQSLMERNNLVQRCEEILGKVDMPSQLRSLESEDKIQWLVSALLEAQDHCYSLQQKIDNLETFCGSLTADLEESRRRTSELEAVFQEACIEKEILSRDLEILKRDIDDSSKRTADFEVRNENLQNDVSMLQEQKLCMEKEIHHTEDAIRRLQELVKDAVEDPFTEDVILGREGIKCFEGMLMKLLEKYKPHFSGKAVPVDSMDVHATERDKLPHALGDPEEENVVTLSKKLEDTMGELLRLKEEKERFMLNNQSIRQVVEELERKKKELEDLLNQEEHKSASLREKLNVAVRKGKSLVQQRDGLKQTIEDLNAEVERLKSEIKIAYKTISEYEKKVENLFAAHERVHVLESENSFLRQRLAETESWLKEKEDSLNSILNALVEINVGLSFSSGNPIDKIKDIGKYLHDLRSQLDTLELESRKSRRAAELLLAELNEVQERNDGLQDELAKSVHKLSEVSREKEIADNAKYEALAHVEKLCYIHSEEKDRHLSEIMVLKSGVDKVADDISAIDDELGDVLSKDLEVLCNMKAMMKSFSEVGGATALGAPFPGSFSGGVMPTKSENKVFVTQIGSLRERLHNHSHLLQEETSQLSEVVMNFQREYTSHKELYDSLKKDVKKLQSIEKERESELHILLGNISLLYETCVSAISKLENWKGHVAGNALASRAPERNLRSETQIVGGNSLTNNIHTIDEKSIRTMCGKLLLFLEDFMRMHHELMEVGQMEMKSTITNLQKELQENDIQRERICMELVNQIKGAETNAKNYLRDLQQAKSQLQDTQRQLNVLSEEHEVLEQRMKELEDQETNSLDLQQKVNSLTDALDAKVQESEALLQALDEEEAEMESLTNKVVGLENELQQKNRDLENLEASRAKALKKLSVTVSKFDELHSLSENLLSEVENLQSQLQEKDGEVSFLRQEVTRCTNDALAVTQMSNKRSSDEIQDFLSWFDSTISRVQVHGIASNDSEKPVFNEYKEVLQNKILFLISELENLRSATQNKDVLLREERSKVEELTRKEHHLRNSLSEMESQLVMLEGAENSTNATESTSKIVEVEQMKNKWVSSGAIAPQVRSLRKTNNDQVAIAIDVDDSSERLEDDDDKAHGFKSLTTSKIVPRFTRPVSDMVDGLWVSCDRALMRQPALRLGVIIYWTLLHAMLAAFAV